MWFTQRDSDNVCVLESAVSLSLLCQISKRCMDVQCSYDWEDGVRGTASLVSDLRGKRLTTCGSCLGESAYVLGRYCDLIRRFERARARFQGTDASVNQFNSLRPNLGSS